MRTAPLGELSTFVRGVTFKPSDVSTQGVGVMRTKNVQEVLGLVDIIRVPASIVKRDDQYLRFGDTLVSSANSWNLVGKACWVPNLPEPFAIGGFVTALRPVSSRVDARYLYRWFTSPRTQSLLRSFSNKTTSISNLNLRRAEEMCVPLPSVEEQRKICTILDWADALRAKRRQVVDRFDTLVQSVFEEMFGSVTLVTSLANLVAEFRYGTSNKATDSGLITLRIPNVVRGSLDLTHLKTVPVTSLERGRLQLVDGDVLIVRSNGNPQNVGRCAVFDSTDVADFGYDPTRFIYASYLIRARPDPAVLDGQFLSTFLASPNGRRALRERARTSAGQYNINVEGIGSVPCPVVPIQEQRTFASRVAEVNAHGRAIQRALAADDELFKSLEARAFDGTS